MKVTVRSIVCGVFAFLTGLIAILGLLACVTEITGGEYSENGFDFLSFESEIFVDGKEDLAWFAAVMGSFSLLQLLFAVVTMIVGAVSVAYPQCGKPATVLVVFTFVFTFIYMIWGIVGVSLYNGLNMTYQGKTLAYLPLIFTLFTMIAYAICRAKVPDIPLGRARMRPNTAPRFYAYPAQANTYMPPAGAAADRYGGATPADARNAPLSADGAMSEEKRLELFERYARLWKEGILSQEEFEAKKKELLKE